MTWAKNVLIGLDQLANTLIGGWPDETLSSRAHRANPVLEKVINAIFFWQEEHCKQAFESERVRAQEPPELRGK